MSLTVLNIAYSFSPVSSDAVGGAELILNDLDEALVARGHRSLVVGCQGSKTAGELFVPAASVTTVLDTEVRAKATRQFQKAIDRALEAAGRVDVVHMHGLDFCDYSIPEEIPLLVTLHLPIAWYPAKAWARFARAQFCCVSQSQRATCPPELRDALVVENGIALPEWSGPQAKQDFALVLGRICPEKNAHAALQAGSMAGMRVVLGGEVFPYREHQQYFHTRVEPLLGREHEFAGVLNAMQKQELLKQAKCLLHPTLAPETSSLVAMEALAAGTPVIAFRSGALTEIVDDGVTGFLVDTVQEMAEAIGRVHEIDPQVCRRTAEQRFSRDRMVASYFDLYERMAARRYAEVLHA